MLKNVFGAVFPRILLSIGALALAGLVAGCGSDPVGEGDTGQTQQQQQQTTPTAQQGQNQLTLSQLAQNPQNVLGRQVAVTAEVAQTLPARGAFTLVSSVGQQDEQDFDEPAGGSGVLVLAQQDVTVPEEITEGDALQVEGTVCRVVANLVQEEDFLFEQEANAELGFLQQFQNRTVIFASQVETNIPREEQLEQGQQGGQQGSGQQGGGQQSTVTVQPGEPEPCPGSGGQQGGG